MDKYVVRRASAPSQPRVSTNAAKRPDDLQKELAAALAPLAACWPVPLSVLASEGFMAFMKDMVPSAKPFTINEIVSMVQDFILTKRAAALQAFKAAVGENGKFAVSVDGGCASGSSGVLGVCAHAMNDNGCLVTAPITCQFRDEDYVERTVAHFYTVVKKGLSSCGLPPAGLHASVYYSPSSCGKPWDLRDNNAMPSVVHRINRVLAFPKHYPVLAPLREAVKELADLFFENESLAKALEELQEDESPDKEEPDYLRIRDHWDTPFGSWVLYFHRYQRLLPALKALAGPKREQYKVEASLAVRVASATASVERQLQAIPVSKQLMKELLDWAAIFAHGREASVHKVRAFLRHTKAFCDFHRDHTNGSHLSATDAKLLRDIETAFNMYFFGQDGRGVVRPEASWAASETFRLAEILGVVHRKLSKSEEGWACINDYTAAFLAAAQTILVPPLEPVGGVQAANAAALVDDDDPYNAAADGTPKPKSAAAWADQLKAEFTEFIAASALVSPSPTKHFYHDFWATAKRRFPSVWAVTRVVLATQPSVVATDSLLSFMPHGVAWGGGPMSLLRLRDVTMAKMLSFYEKEAATPLPAMPVPCRLEEWKLAQPSDYYFDDIEMSYSRFDVSGWKADYDDTMNWEQGEDIAPYKESEEEDDTFEEAAVEGDGAPAPLTGKRSRDGAPLPCPPK